MRNNEQQHLSEILRTKQRRLNILEQRAAREGYHSTPEIILEIEDLRNEIPRLKKLLSELDNRKYPNNWNRSTSRQSKRSALSTNKTNKSAASLSGLKNDIGSEFINVGTPTNGIVSRIEQLGNVPLLATTVLLFKVGFFVFVGAAFGWCLGYNLAGDKYLSYPQSENYIYGSIGLLVSGAIGLMTGLTFIPQKRRRRGYIPWWGHMVGILIMGSMSSTAEMRQGEQLYGQFWVLGVSSWLFVWLIFLGGYKDLK